MKHILDFILFEKRELKERWETTLSEAEFMQLYKIHCKAHETVKKKTLIFRRDQHLKDTFAKVVPKINEHWHSQNYESVILDNLPCFSNFPKRGKSIMAANDATRFQENSLDAVRKRSDAYVMIPFDNIIVAICPFDDFWSSFDHTHGPLGDMFDEIDAFFGIAADNEFASYDVMKEQLVDLNGKKISEICADTNNVIVDLFKRKNDDTFSFEKFMSYLNDFFKADAKKFKIKSYNKSFKVELFNEEGEGVHAEGHEVWTEGPVLMIQLAAYEKLFGKVDYYFNGEDEDEIDSDLITQIEITDPYLYNGIGIVQKRIKKLDPEAVEVRKGLMKLSKPFEEDFFLQTGGLRPWYDKIKFSK